MITEDKSYGVIVLCKDKFLILKQQKGHWSFPKGHAEGEENNKEAALRELSEEAGITACVISNLPTVFEEYTFTETTGVIYHKIVEYFIGSVENEDVVVQEKEIAEYKWLTYDDALLTLTYQNTKDALVKAKESMDKS